MVGKEARIEAYLQSLNDEQKKVVAIGPGMCVVAGCPGSGKTTAIVGRVARLVRDGLPGKYILPMTFTKAAAAELTSRIMNLGITDCRFGTIHSLCWEFLQSENPTVRGNYLKVDSGNSLEMELKKLVVQFQQRKRLPSRGVDLIELERYISDCKATGACYLFGNPYGLNSEAEPRQLDKAETFSVRVGEDVSPQALYDLYTEYELRRSALSLIGYDDMILWAWMHLAIDKEALTRWRNRWSAIITDEAQDSTPIQWDLALVLGGYPSIVMPEFFPELEQKKSIMFAGQVAQCLTGDTQITTASGDRQLDTITRGALVQAPICGGSVLSKVLHSGRRASRKLVTIETRQGRTLAGSPEHLVFCALPERAEGWYTYLMYRHDLGYRIGSTHGAHQSRRDSLAIRAKNEDADRIWFIGRHHSKAAAGAQEMSLALRYQIPQLPFVVYGRNLRLGEKERNEIFAEFGRNGERLLKDLWMSPDFPVWMPSANSKSRALVCLVLGGRNQCEVSVESRIIIIPRVQAAIKKELGLQVTEVRRGRGRIRINKLDPPAAHELADRIRSIMQRHVDIPVQLIIRLSSARGEHGAKFMAVPLGAIVEGLTVWTDYARCDTVVSVKRAEEEVVLHDIQTTCGAYFANGIAVHNSLYMWRSADPAIFIDFCTSPKSGLHELVINYRSTPIICKTAEIFAKGEEWAIPDKIEPGRTDGEAGSISFKTYAHGMIEAASIAKRIKELILAGQKVSEIVVLSRLSFFLSLVEIECIRNKIPYVLRKSGGFIESREAQGVLSYMRVAAGVDSDGTCMKKTIMNPFKYVTRDELLEGANRVTTGKARHLLDALLQLQMYPKKKRSLLDLRDLLAELQSDIERGMRPGEILRKVVDKTDYIEFIRKEDGSATPDASKAGIIEELIGLASLFEDTMQFLSFTDQLKASLKLGRSYYQVKEDQARDAVVLSTIHRAKGLQFDIVFIGDVNQGRFPWNRGVSMAEELRLMYTAITRARNTVVISNSLQDGDVESSILARVKSAYTEASGILLNGEGEGEEAASA